MPQLISLPSQSSGRGEIAKRGAKVVYGVTFAPPPLPPQTPSTAWVCVAKGWGAQGGYREFCQFFYFMADPATLGTWHANTFAADFSAAHDPSWLGTYSLNIKTLTPYVYGWDGTTFHAGFNFAEQIGGLPFLNRPLMECVLIKKFASIGLAQVNGWWHSAAVNSTWASPRMKLTTLGKLQFVGWANFIVAPFISEGNTWFPAIFTPKTTADLYKIEFAQVLPDLHIYRKRLSTPNGPHGVHDNQWLPPVPTPTGSG
jgi:hypothetical protein